MTKGVPKLLQLIEQSYKCIQLYNTPTLFQWREWNKY